MTANWKFSLHWDCEQHFEFYNSDKVKKNPSLNSNNELHLHPQIFSRKFFLIKAHTINLEIENLVILGE